jgi:DNA/RNA-binding domain of Phe-tRNA-synthetase-like protein
MADNRYSKGSILINREISILFPGIVIGWLEAGIRNSETNPDLWNILREKSEEISRTMDEESIRRVEGISLGKQAYRHMGKDPNRYRLSAEALMRRVVKGKGLYPISTAVDSLNLVSLSTGITIGGFDADVVSGDIELGIGLPGEEFIAIGRGPLNVENLPVYRDRAGAIGNPTSDSERTRITLTTERVLMLITGFYGAGGIDAALEQLSSLLKKYCDCHPCLTGYIGNI